MILNTVGWGLCARNAPLSPIWTGLVSRAATRALVAREPPRGASGGFVRGGGGRDCPDCDQVLIRALPEFATQQLPTAPSQRHCKHQCKEREPPQALAEPDIGRCQPEARDEPDDIRPTPVDRFDAARQIKD